MIVRLFAGLRSLWRGLVSRSEIESEIGQEFLHHLELRTEDLIRSGLSCKDAARRARMEFGTVEAVKEEARRARGLGLFDEVRFSWLDVKLGLRLLVKHPGLTLVATFALAVGIPVGLAPVHLSNAIEAPLPVDEGERIRAIRYWNVTTDRPEGGTSFDLSRFRGGLTTFAALGAVRSDGFNVDSEDGSALPVLGAEVTASTFDVLKARPLMGRVLETGDELPGASDVVVVGHALWQSRLGSDPDVVGTSLRIGGVPHHIVGVMPEGFLFPVAQKLWLPLRAEVEPEPGRGLGLRVLGRLSDGVTPEEAQAEVAALGQRLAVELPQTHGGLRAEVVPFGLSYVGLARGGLEAMPEFYFFQFLAAVLLLVACANVAMLIFARTVARFRELALRTALGAGRGRILSQMFVESLVLALLAAGLGLLSVDFLLGRLHAAAAEAGAILPYWLDLGVTKEAVVWALALAVMSAVLAGLAPALKLTGKKVAENVESAQMDGAGIRFGGVTGALIVADVAMAVTAVGFALGLVNTIRDARSAEDLVGIAAEEYLAVELRLPAGGSRANGAALDDEELTRRLATTVETLVERLEGEPRVRRVAVADALPRMDHRSQRVEMDGAESTDRGRGRYVRVARIDVGFFDALNRPILSGRGFDQADLGDNRSAVIVNTAFVDRHLEGRNPVGRRIRFLRSARPEDHQPSPWYEIVGVVGHLGMNVVNPSGEAGLYLPAAPGEIHPVRLAIHLGDSPEDFIPRLRELVAEVDPTAFLRPPVALNRVFQGDWYLGVAATAGLGLLVGILVALAASALYAIMSFSVLRRTREIGIRTALGARRTTLVLTVLRRSLAQIGLGVLLGMPLSGWIFMSVEARLGATRTGFAVALMTGVSVMALTALLSCLAPARRILKIEPTVALKVE